MNRSRITAAALFREVVRNIIAFPVRTVVLYLASLTVGFATVALPLAEVSGIVESFERQQFRGLDTLSVTGVDGQGLSAAECDSAQAIVGVSASGGLISSERMTSTLAPDTPLVVHSVTPGYIAIMFPHEPQLWTATVVAGSQISDELGLTTNAIIHFRVDTESELRNGARLDVRGVADRLGRIDGYNRDIFVAAIAAGNLSECTVVSLPGMRDQVSQALSGWFPTSELRVQPILQSSQLEIDPETLLDKRGSQWTWLVGGVALATFAGFVWWSRRDEVALYQLLGFGKAHILKMASLDVLLTIVIPAQFGAALAAASAVITAAPLAALLAVGDLMRLDALLVALCALAYVAGSSRRPVEALKGR